MMAGANNILGPIDTSAPNPFRAPISPDFYDPVHMPTMDYSGANNPFAWSASGGTSGSDNSGGGFWSGLWNHTIGPVYNDLRGGLEGLTNPALQQNADLEKQFGSLVASNPNVTANAHGLRYTNAPNTWTNPFAGLWQGLRHPGQAHQMYEQNMNTSMQGQPMLTQLVGRGAVGTFTDPITYVPLGPLARVLKLPEALNATKNAALSLPGGMNVANALATAFKPIGGARQSFVDMVSRMHGSTQSGANAIMNQLQNILQGTTPEIRDELVRAIEPTAPGTTLSNPIFDALRKPIEPILDQSTQTSLDRGLINGVIDPTSFGVGRYLPHIPLTKFEDNTAPFSDIRLPRTNVDAAKSRTLEGTIHGINAKNPDGPLFETDIAKILAHHLGQQNKAIAIRDLIDHTMSTGIESGGTLKAGDWFPGTVQKAAEYSRDGKTVLLPEPEVRFLKGLTENGSTGLKNWKNVYRMGVNAANRSMFATSPLIHIVNNLGWQTFAHAPGVFLRMLKPSLWKEAFTGVRPGSMMDQALKSGALHLTSELGKKTDTRSMANELVRRLDEKPSALSLFKKLAQGYNNLTPNVEKIYRTAAFQRALERGMSPDDATRWIRSVYGGNAPGTASYAENVLTSIDPFFNWTKTAIGSNTKNFLNHPLPYVAAMHGWNAINQMNTNGHNMFENKNPLSVALGTKNAKGLSEFLLPYFPFLDPLKLGNDIRQQGPLTGIANFLFGRTTPVVRFPTQMLTKETNPFGLPPDKRSILPSPDLPPSSPFNREPLFGQSGPLVPYWLSQLQQDIMNPIGESQRMSGESPTAKALTNPFISLYGSISAPDTVSDAKHAKYLQGQQQGEIRKWLQKYGGQ